MCARVVNMMSDHESRLWDQFREGDQTAYASIMNKYTKPLFNYGYQICRDREIVKDCIQEVFFELWMRRDRISPVNCVKWYLIKSIRSRILKDQVKWNLGERLHDDYMFIVELNMEARMIQNDDQLDFVNRVQAVINGLPPRQREIMYLRFYQDLEFDQICEIMDISRQSVHNLLQKAYKSFRAEWILILFLSLYDFNSF
jgi:RNA polymerase sigma factor (sigma-70 family)